MAPHTETTLDNLSNPHHHPYPSQERRTSQRLQRSAWRPVLASALALWLGACGGQTPGPDVPPPVDPPRTCGSCLSYEQCMPSGSCGINPNSTWFFAVDSARIASTKTTGDAWDAFGGAPDPYVVLDTRRTTTQQDTFTPLWQEGATYTATNLLNQGVTVQVIDDDISAPDPIGGPTVVRPSEADLRRGTLTVANLGQATDGINDYHFSEQYRAHSEQVAKRFVSFSPRAVSQEALAARIRAARSAAEQPPPVRYWQLRAPIDLELEGAR